MSSPNPGNNRSDSVSSSESAPTSPSGRRRSSLFANLTAQKRGNEDPVSMARRQSMTDARPTAGFIGKMWNNYVHGPSNSK